jgi:5S rRNA maturation endonuclease (ribonuclease M5)
MILIDKDRNGKKIRGIILVNSAESKEKIEKGRVNRRGKCQRREEIEIWLKVK